MSGVDSLSLTFFNNVWASRYLSVAGVVVLIYDHLLTLDKEVELIWKAPWKTPKALWLFLRYLVPCTLIIHTYQLSGLGNSGLSDIFCKIWFPISLALGVASIAVGNFLVLIHVWNLSERRRLFILWSLILFIATQIGSVICLGFALKNLIPEVTFNREIGLCIMVHRGLLMLIWAPGLCLEAVMFIVVLWNALDRPRTLTSDFTKALHRDGMVYFASLFILRLLNLLLFTFAPISLIFLGVYFIWCSTTMTVTRLVLNLRRLTLEKREKCRLEQDSAALSELEYKTRFDGRPRSAGSETASVPMRPLIPEIEYVNRSTDGTRPSSDTSKWDSTTDTNSRFA